MRIPSKFAYPKHIYLNPKVALRLEQPNISLLFLILTKLKISMSCWYPPNSSSQKNLGKLIFFLAICVFIKSTKSASPYEFQSKPRI